MRDSSRIRLPTTPQRSTSSRVVNQAGAEQEVHTHVHGERLSLWSGCAKSYVTEVRRPRASKQALRSNHVPVLVKYVKYVKRLTMLGLQTYKILLMSQVTLMSFQSWLSEGTIVTSGDQTLAPGAQNSWSSVVTATCSSSTAGLQEMRKGSIPLEATNAVTGSMLHVGQGG